MHKFFSANDCLTGLHGEFAKYQGNGNDFIIFEVDKTWSPDLLSPIAQKLCDRHWGVGADGIIILSKGQTFKMSLYNADGSLAKNCGNGLRCVARHIFNKFSLSEVCINFAGTEYLCKEKGPFVSVNMGRGKVKKLSPFYFKGNDLNAEVFKVFMGNEHLVFILERKICDLDSLLKIVRENFPDEVESNIGFVFLESGQFFSQVFERGVGWTNACGTGACAAGACLASLYPKEGNLVIEQLGGKIEVDAATLGMVNEEQEFDITQTGAAQAVYFGYWPSDEELLGQEHKKAKVPF